MQRDSFGHQKHIDWQSQRNPLPTRTAPQLWGCFEGNRETKECDLQTQFL